MYDLRKKQTNQTLESMQEIVLLNEIMALVQEPITGSKDFTKEDSGWIQVKNAKICSNIQEMLSDPIKNKIFSLLQKNSLTTQQIIEELDIPFTSGYRKISGLIQDGILVESRILKKRYYKKIVEYTTILNSIRIELDKGNMTVFIKIKSI
jgi:hypothetical protein